MTTCAAQSVKDAATAKVVAGAKCGMGGGGGGTKSACEAISEACEWKANPPDRSVVPE